MLIQPLNSKHERKKSLTVAIWNSTVGFCKLPNNMSKRGACAAISVNRISGGNVPDQVPVAGVEAIARQRKSQVA